VGGGSCGSGSSGNSRTQQRRSSFVVIPPMQICPGDLLVYSKVLTQRNSVLGNQFNYIARHRVIFIPSMKFFARITSNWNYQIQLLSPSVLQLAQSLSPSSLYGSL
jgi:hypothetical protein